MPGEQQVVQSAHAVLEMARRHAVPGEHPHLVLCSVPTQQQLLQAASRLTQAGIPFSVFHEADRQNEATALSTVPLRGTQRHPLRRYRCLQLKDLNTYQERP